MPHLMKAVALAAVLALPTSANAAIIEWRYTGTISSGLFGYFAPGEPTYGELPPHLQVGSPVVLTVYANTHTPDTCALAGQAEYQGLRASATVGGVAYTNGAGMIEIGLPDFACSSSHPYQDARTLRMFGGLTTTEPVAFAYLGWGMYGGGNNSEAFPTNAPGSGGGFDLFLRGNVFSPSGYARYVHVSAGATTTVLVPAPPITMVTLLGCVWALARRRSRRRKRPWGGAHSVRVRSRIPTGGACSGSCSSNGAERTGGRAPTISR